MQAWNENVSLVAFNRCLPLISNTIDCLQIDKFSNIDEFKAAIDKLLDITQSNPTQQDGKVTSIPYWWYTK